MVLDTGPLRRAHHEATIKCFDLISKHHVQRKAATGYALQSPRRFVFMYILAHWVMV